MTMGINQERVKNSKIQAWWSEREKENTCGRVSQPLHNPEKTVPGSDPSLKVIVLFRLSRRWAERRNVSAPAGTDELHKLNLPPKAVPVWMKIQARNLENDWHQSKVRVPNLWSCVNFAQRMEINWQSQIVTDVREFLIENFDNQVSFHRFKWRKW
jgi:hypothetical protein